MSTKRPGKSLKLNVSLSVKESSRAARTKWKISTSLDRKKTDKNAKKEMRTPKAKD